MKQTVTSKYQVPGPTRRVAAGTAISSAPLLAFGDVLRDLVGCNSVMRAGGDRRALLELRSH